ncbi:MAG TPA: DNRLRE domain-containing protein [Gaiellaceae bacterium]|nr:DNRLRE domain-containing protein [Gaiellaceae bacterium]
MGLRKLVALLAAACLAGWAAPVGGATVPDVGYQGPSYGSASAPTGEKPESKLWFNDGGWWADMWDPVAKRHFVNRLDLATQTWSKTATMLDDRASTKADVLWDASQLKLYVASHTFSTNASAATGASRLYRYSYALGTQTYALDPGFPVVIADFKVEALTIAKGTNGVLWATWVQGGRTWVRRSLGSDLLWGAPFVLSPAGTEPSSDDISAVIAFGGDKIAVMWSDQAGADAFHMSVHVDGHADTDWAYELVDGTRPSDDHINLKTDAAGRIYAAVKRTSGAKDRLIDLLVRQADGTWSSNPVGASADDHTRPIVILDEGNDAVFVFASGPEPERVAATGTASLWRKGSFADSIVFPLGLGTLVLNDSDVYDMNNPTSSKQNVSAATGMVVLAGNDKADRYWHAYHPLVPAPANAEFASTGTANVAPFDVGFQDLSAAGLFGPTSWSWDFGDGTTGTGPAPKHTYLVEGTYTVSLTVTDGVTSDTETKAGLITVLPGMSLTPVADAYVRSDAPAKKYGTASELRARTGTLTSPASYRSFVRFDVPALTQAVQSVKLRLWVTDASRDGGAVALAANEWTESLVTWDTQPTVLGGTLAALGQTLTGTWVEWDLTSTVTGAGAYTFALSSTLSDGAYYSSREGSKKPQLRVLYATP